MLPLGPPSPSSWFPASGFTNHGLSTWNASREKWRKRTVPAKPPPMPVDYEEVVKGLTAVQRTFELPGKMRLEDVVRVFVEIWECEQGY